jgi:hypothetical protein
MVETDIVTSAAASPISKLCMMRPSKRTLLLSLVSHNVLDVTLLADNFQHVSPLDIDNMSYWD